MQTENQYRCPVIFEFYAVQPVNFMPDRTFSHLKQLFRAHLFPDLHTLRDTS